MCTTRKVEGTQLNAGISESCSKNINEHQSPTNYYSIFLSPVYIEVQWLLA